MADAPLFLSVDDTIVAKAGQCFDFVSKLFDHAMHTGSAYVNGHCFVSLMLSVPVDKDMKGGCSGGILQGSRNAARKRYEWPSANKFRMSYF